MREARIAVMIQVEVSWEDLGGNLRSVPARMEDKSLSGACIRVKKPIEVGARVRIQWRFEQFSGAVRYCRREDWDYVVGIQRDRPESLLTGQGGRADETIQTEVKSIESPVAPVGAQTKEPSKGQTNVLSSPEAREDTVRKVPAVRRAVETEAVAPMENRAAVMPSGGSGGQKDIEIGREMMNRDRLGLSRAEELRRVRRTGVRPTPRAKGREVPKERKSMARKWLELAPWQKRREGLIASAGNNGTGDGTSETENLMPEVTASTNKVAGECEPEGNASLQVELLPMEEVYRAAGIMNAQKGYSIHKVVEMLNSGHIGGLSKEMRRAAVLMALDAAGISIEQVQRDAKTRQEALESYEAEQKRQAEAEWARKAEENVQIQEELERVKARYMARVSRNLDGMAREKATFDTWVTVKQREIESIAEVLDLCVKPEAVEPVSAPLAKAAVAGAQALRSVPPKV